jgi:hypothetical protein
MGPSYITDALTQAMLCEGHRDYPVTASPGPKKQKVPTMALNPRGKEVREMQKQLENSSQCILGCGTEHQLVQCPRVVQYHKDHPSTFRHIDWSKADSNTNFCVLHGSSAHDSLHCRILSSLKQDSSSFPPASGQKRKRLEIQTKSYNKKIKNMAAKLAELEKWKEGISQEPASEREVIDTSQTPTSPDRTKGKEKKGGKKKSKE